MLGRGGRSRGGKRWVRSRARSRTRLERRAGGATWTSTGRSAQAEGAAAGASAQRRGGRKIRARGQLGGGVVELSHCSAKLPTTKGSKGCSRSRQAGLSSSLPASLSHPTFCYSSEPDERTSIHEELNRIAHQSSIAAAMSFLRSARAGLAPLTRIERHCYAICATKW